MPANVSCNRLLTEIGIAVGATIPACVVGTHVHRDGAQAVTSLPWILSEVLVSAGQAPDESGVDTASMADTISAEVYLLATGHYLKSVLAADLADRTAQSVQVIAVVTVY